MPAVQQQRRCAALLPRSCQLLGAKQQFGPGAENWVGGGGARGARCCCLPAAVTQ